MTRTALIATMLMVVTACDKANPEAHGARAGVADPPRATRLDLSGPPTILFQVFGGRGATRMMPVAALRADGPQPIVLTADGWRQFDTIYGRAGSRYTVYRDGRPAGRVAVRQRMWEPTASPLYALPGCSSLIPMTAVALDSTVKTGYAIELLASNVRLGRVQRGRAPSRVGTVSVARAVARAVAEVSGIPAASLDSLDFRAIAVNTGASPDATVIASYVEPDHDDANGTAIQLFAIADGGVDDYRATYAHASYGPSRLANYQRYVDHLDLDGDGIDEIVLEAWRYGGDTFPIVLGYRSGRWREIFRGRSSWCLDEKPTR